MKIETRKKQVHLMARQALLTFRAQVPVYTRPFRSANLLFQMAHYGQFQKPLMLKTYGGQV